MPDTRQVLTVADLTKQINDILTNYCKDVDSTMLEVETEVAKEAIKKLKNTSPRSGKATKHYADTWTDDKKAKKQYAETIIYNKQGQLTHLLENGHDVVRHGKVVGHVAPQKHIKPVEEWVKEEMVKRMEEKL